MAQEKKGWVVELEDGRQITVPQEIGTEKGAQEYAERWAALNPAMDGDVIPYAVTLDDGQEITVPATSPDNARAFVEQVYTPFGRALNDARERAASTPGQTRAFARGATFNLVTPLDAATAAAETGINNLLSNVGLTEGAGYGMGDAFNAVRIAENERAELFREAEPGQAIGFELAGGVLSPVNKIAGPAIVGRGSTGLMSRGLLPATARGAAVGTGLGAVGGLAGSDPGEELQDASRGAVIGGLTGGAVPGVAGTATAVTRGLGLDRVIPTTVNRLSGGRLMSGNVDSRAMRSLGDAMRADGVSEDQIRQAMNDAMRYGITPNLLDLVGPNATRTRTLIQGAAMAPGPGMTAATQYRNEVAGSLQDDAIEQAYRLTPGETRSAQQVRDAMGVQQRQMADVDYAPIYARERVPVTDEVRRALEGMNPQMAAARQESSFRFPERAAEIDALASGQPVQEVSAAALDRVQRQLGTASRNAVRSLENPNPGLSADYAARQGALEQALENVPGLQAARGAFRGYANADEAVELGLSGMQPRTRPQDYADELARMEAVEQAAAQASGRAVPGARQSAGIGVRDQIVNTLGNLPEGATGAINRFATARNPGQVLSSTFGQQSADDFAGAMALLRDRMNTARLIDPSQGSQTALRGVAEGLVENVPTTPQGVVMGILRKIRRGATLTDADREALVRLGTQFRQEPITPLPPRGVPVTGRAVTPLVSLGVQE